jgi:5,6-dimethylbenzimidazole synthase
MIIFDDGFRARLLELFTWRRDVRRFRPDLLPPQTLERLIHIACLSPSVGLSQPWRFVIVDDPARRRAIAEVFEACNAEALSSYPRGLGDRYAKLKLAGIKEAPAQLTVFADRSTRAGHGLGRRTMPEMIEYSVVAAVHTMWLAARAEGIGLGWVSILDPARMAEILDVPPDWHLIGHLCLGYPETEEESPELERADWECRRPPSKAIIRR